HNHAPLDGDGRPGWTDEFSDLARWHGSDHIAASTAGGAFVVGRGSREIGLISIFGLAAAGDGGPHTFECNFLRGPVGTPGRLLAAPRGAAFRSVSIAADHGHYSGADIGSLRCLDVSRAK